MKKSITPTPVASTSAPSNWKTGDQVAPAIGVAPALGPMIHQAPTQQGIREVVRKAIPKKETAEPNYVDPYLFETGYYESRTEYEELMARPQSTIQLREDVENTLRPRRNPRSRK